MRESTCWGTRATDSIIKSGQKDTEASIQPMISTVILSTAKYMIWIVEDSGELTKTWLKYAVDKVFQHDGNHSCWAETLH